MKLLGSYAYRERKGVANQFRSGEGLVGQCALEKERILVTNVPQDYIQINSGLGESKPHNIVVLPVLFEGEVKAVIELASFNRYSDIHLTFLDQLKESIGIVLNTIAANMRTEDLLKQSQSLTAELQTQQHELKTTNERLERQAESLRQEGERDHRRSRNAGFQGAHVGLRISVARQLLLRETGPPASFADALADPLRERGVVGRRARGGARAGHGGSVHALASMT